MTAYEVPTINHSDWDATEKRVPLFTIGRPNPDFDEARGESEDNPREILTTYTMPGRPHVGLGLAYLRMARLQGTVLAGAWLLEEAVGTEGFFALAAEPDLDPEVMRGIISRAQDIILGGLEGPKGS